MSNQRVERDFRLAALLLSAVDLEWLTLTSGRGREVPRALK
jgi:hypothetical protein